MLKEDKLWQEIVALLIKTTKDPETKKRIVDYEELKALDPFKGTKKRRRTGLRIIYADPEWLQELPSSDSSSVDRFRLVDYQIDSRGILTEEERLLLGMVAEGYTLDEITEKSGIPRRTVARRLDSGRSKLGQGGWC